MGLNQFKSKIIENGPLILSIVINLHIPLLGLFATFKESNIRFLYLFIAAIFTFVLSFPAAHDVFLSSFYLKHGSIIFLIITSIAFVASIYISFKNRKKLKYYPYSLLFAFIVLIIFGFYPDNYRGGTSYLVTNSLSPYLKANNAVLFSASRGKPKKGFTVIRRSDENDYFLGYVLAIEGDRIGVAGGIPVVCKNIDTSENCFDVRNVCEYLLGGAQSIDLELSNSRILKSNEIALASYLDVPTFKSLNYTVKKYEKMYHLERIFDMNTTFNFGIKAPSEYCKLPTK